MDNKELKALMDALGIRAQVRVWNLVKTGANKWQIDELINQILDEQAISDKEQLEAANKIIKLRKEGIPYKIFGQHLIEQVAIDDMNWIARLPYVVWLSLQADAHRVKEKHVPVGGVVKTLDCILPGVVGNDIACSVMLTVIDQVVNDQAWWDQFYDAFDYILRTYTYFGIMYNPLEVHGNPLFDEIGSPKAIEALVDQLQHEDAKKLVRKLAGTARNQFGTSGDGNHFIEIGYTDTTPVYIYNGKDWPISRTGLRPSPDSHLAILSHFGSRGVGAVIADYYLDLANELNPVPKGMEDNAPLFFDTDGHAEDYLVLMNWAGKFAQNSHAYIHDRLMVEMSKRGIIDYSQMSKFSIYTKHNFAWVKNDGIWHRKGSTPAPVAEYAMIPATMGDKSQIVIGLGNEESGDSASHGAGRKMSRSVALQHIHGDTAETVKKRYGINLIGGGNDEHPDAYKSIKEVMDEQKEIVKTVGTFRAVHVRMADPRVMPRKGRK